MCTDTRLGLYKHSKKGTIYRVFAIGIHTETNEEIVAYYGEESKESVWFRPAQMFFENIILQGKIVPRFERIT